MIMGTAENKATDSIYANFKSIPTFLLHITFSKNLNTSFREHERPNSFSFCILSTTYMYVAIRQYVLY